MRKLSSTMRIWALKKESNDSKYNSEIFTKNICLSQNKIQFADIFLKKNLYHEKF